MTWQNTLNTESLKTLTAYFLEDCDHPFSMVNCKSYQEILTLCNSQVIGMLVKRHKLSQHTQKIYYHDKKYIKKHLNPIKAIHNTQDEYTSPKQIALISIKGNLIPDDWQRMDLTLDLP